MLSITNLKVRYGNTEALHGISFTVNKGEIVTLIGANGAGKTTTLLSIARLGPPEGPKIVEGDITYNGQSLLSVPPHEVVTKMRMALAPEGRHIFGNLTVEENLKLATYARKDHDVIKTDYDRVYQLFPRLVERRKQRSESLSGGEQQMVAIARALAGHVKVLLLDEPFEGLSPAMTEEVFNAVLRLKGEVTMLIVDHNLDLTLALSDRALVLDRGRISHLGPAELLLKDLDYRREKLWI